MKSWPTPQRISATIDLKTYKNNFNLCTILLHNYLIYNKFIENLFFLRFRNDLLFLLENEFHVVLFIKIFKKIGRKLKFAKILDLVLFWQFLNV